MAAEIVWQHRRAVFKVSGETDFRELRAVEDRFYSDPRSDQIRQKILDITGLQTLDLTQDELAVLAAFHVGQSKSSPGVNFAIVAPHGPFDEAVDGFAALMQASAWRTRRFTSLDEAQSWLEAAND